MKADALSRIIVNFSHKEARFDSRSEPLLRMFRLLPIARLIRCAISRPARTKR